MPLAFTRTLRALDRDDARRPLGLVAAGAVLSALWLAWLVVAPVGVYAESHEARIEADAEAHFVDVDADGRVTAVNVAVGDAVEPGDVLVELDGAEAVSQLVQARATLAALEIQRHVLRGQVETQAATTSVARSAEQSAVQEAAARLTEAEATARLAHEEATRLRTLAAQGFTTEVDARRAETLAMETAAAETAAGRRLELLSLDRRALLGDRKARRAEVEAEIALLDGQIAAAAVEVTRAEETIRRNHVISPVSGIVGELAPLRPGAVVRRGETVATVVPAGDLKVVARFRPSDAVGRVTPGMSARVRLDGFSWTEYGSVSATVRTVAAEPRDGLVRVDLDLGGEATAIPLQHGLPGTVDVEVERVSPLTLLFRVAGSRLAGSGS